VRLALVLAAVMCLASVSAKEDPELQVLAKALAAKKAAVHTLSSTLQKEIPAAAAASHVSPMKTTAAAISQTEDAHKMLARATAVKQSSLQKLKEATKEEAKSDADLIKDSIDDTKVGDFSKDKNKHDHRMMNGKFDWLLKASSPLYSAAKTVAGAAQHQLHKVLGKPVAGASGSALQEEGNATETSGADDNLDKVKSEDAADQTKFLEFSKDKEMYFFATWIVVLVAVLGILGLCLLYARQCLGAASSDGAVPAGAKPNGFSGGGYGTGGAR